VRHRNGDAELRPKIKILAVEIKNSGAAVPESQAISALTPWISSESEEVDPNLRDSDFFWKPQTYGANFFDNVSPISAVLLSPEAVRAGGPGR
jgi:hypothetical protein